MSEPKRTVSKQHRWMLPVAVMVLAACGIGIGVVVAANTNRHQPNDSHATQLTNVQRACQNWMGTYSGARPSDDWCTNMTTWMNQQAANGQTGSMMWGNPDRMATTCRQWASGNGSSMNAQWCDDMVTWMRRHVNEHSDNSMMNGPMMGR